MKDIFKKLEKIYILVLIILLAIVAVFGIYQVVARYALGWPIYWTEESIRYLYIAAVMLGIGLALQKNAYTSITILADFLKRTTKIGYRLLLIFHRLVHLAFCGLMLYFGLQLVMKAGGALSPAIRIPFFYVYLPIPIGGLLGFLVEANRLYGVITNRQGLEKEEEVRTI
jgi:TRAP-type C4-dicarboxylate transport system permease small subunit